jgi:hypothetical protein
LAFNYLFAGFILVGMLISLPWFKDSLSLPGGKAGLISAETPVEATQFLVQEQLPGPLFHFMPFGSYLIWAAQPEYPVFVDSRIELYPQEIWQHYLAISAGQGDWEGRLGDYGINTLMLNPQFQRSLVRAADASSRWELVYQDGNAVLFVRESRR